MEKAEMSDTKFPFFSTEKNQSRRRFLQTSAAAGAIAGFNPAISFAADTAIMQRAIPVTGEMLPIVGIGTSRVFDVLNDPAGMKTRQEILQTMFDSGATLIDTAPSYQDAEQVIGELLSRMKAHRRAFVATKVASHGRERGIEEINESFKYLRTDKIDLIQVHNLIDTDTQLNTLRGLKKEGRIRYLGITHYRDGSHDELEAAMKKHKIDFVQINYSLADRNASQRILPLAADQGVAVLINRPFGRGRLFRAVRGKALPGWAAEIDAKSWAQVFLKYVLANQAVTAVIPGTDKVAYMKDNLDAGRGRLPDAAMVQQMEKFWDSL